MKFLVTLGGNFSWLIWSLTNKELKARYKSALLGFLWAFLNPLITIVVLSLVFSYFLKIQVENYPVFLLSGVLPWTFFSSALVAGTSSLVNNRDLIKKTSFRREAIPLSTLLAAAINFSTSILLFLLIYLVSGFNLDPNMLLFIPAIILETTLLLGIILITSSLEIYYRDVSFIVSALVFVWFYITPIFYPLSSVPNGLLFLYKLNPMVGVISVFRTAFLGISYFTLDAVIVSLIETVVILVIGLLIFRRREVYFADWI